MSSGSEPPAGPPPTSETDVAPPAPGRPGGFRLPGMAPGQRPATWLIVTVAAIVVLIGAIIAVDATTHRPAKPAALKPAPAFTLQSLANPAQHVSLAAYRGQPVILNFFASWCAPCKKETPLLAGYYRASKGKVAIIGVDADDSATAARQFLSANGVAYPVGFETTPALANAYGVSEIGIPETFFLDSGHRIVKRVLGDVTMKDLTAGVALMDGAAR
jgi:cytochrome c biogenesis protein CcmG/thiol:disulfide interchange protein DsbE